jgi:hypothetical protein
MYTLFVDLDGVLVDFDAGVVRVTGRPPHAQSPRAMWGQLARTHGFYEHLAWCPDGPALWEHVRGLTPTVLTGLPLGRWAAPQKLAWCARELGSDIPVITCMSRQKAERAQSATPAGATPVLVDDRESLQDAFEAMGGVFIHHTSAENSISRLDGLGGPFVAARVSGRDDSPNSA